MPKTVSNIVAEFHTRRALVGAIQSHQHGPHPARPQPQGTRPHSGFPLTLTVGLMTIGVILIVSLLQLLTSYFG